MNFFRTRCRKTLGPSLRSGLAAAAAAEALGSSQALACAVCFGAQNPRVLRSYLWSTVALSLLPLAILALIAVVAIRYRRRTAPWRNP